MNKLVKKSVEDWLKGVDYRDDPNYVPSEFALEFINFIKMVNGEQGEENASPVIHFKWLDNLCNRKQDSVALCSRGFAKSSVFAEYLFLYLAVFGSIPGFGKVDYALYVSDSIDNGVKKMRNRIERRYQNSDFLREYLVKVKITDTRWYFVNKFGKEIVITGHGVSTGVRGTVELNTRPQLAVLDDLISDEDARSQTVIEKVEDVVYSAIDNALHPKRRKIIWCGTPFNAKDPLYKAVESGAWYVSVFPVCERFPCKKSEFKGGWEDRFPYEFVKTRYDKAVMTGKVSNFNQELMLRIMSEEERLIEDGDIQWYKHRNVVKNRGAYNFYITTDFATSDKEHADFSVLSVWGLNNIGEWYWVDGKCKQMLMDESMDHLFRLAQKWQPQAVGVEITGQQGGFIQWIKQLMQDRSIYFSLACPLGSNKPGLRPTKDKMSRFQTNAVPLFKSNKIHFPEELKESGEMIECMEELKLATIKGFKSKHDDFNDTITMLGEIQVWRPSEVSPEEEEAVSHGGLGGVWGGHESGDSESGSSSYFV